MVVFNKALVGADRARPRRRCWATTCSSFVPESERLKLMRGDGRVAEGRVGLGASRLRLKGSAGREVRVAFATSTVMNQVGEVEGVIAIGQDLTRMKELERRVIQAEKLASLGQLAASVVHEINNPMTAVATYADALLKRSIGQPNVDPADVEKYRRISENSRAGAALHPRPGQLRAARPGQARGGRDRRADRPGDRLLRARAAQARGAAARRSWPRCRPSSRCGRTWCRCSST